VRELLKQSEPCLNQRRIGPARGAAAIVSSAQCAVIAERRTGQGCGCRWLAVCARRVDEAPGDNDTVLFPAQGRWRSAVPGSHAPTAWRRVGHRTRAVRTGRESPIPTGAAPGSRVAASMWRRHSELSARPPGYRLRERRGATQAQLTSPGSKGAPSGQRPNGPAAHGRTCGSRFVARRSAPALRWHVTASRSGDDEHRVFMSSYSNRSGAE
jgi:hypothetical protein